MEWTELNSLDQLNLIVSLSETQPVLIYKHSHRCNICNTALGRLERKWQNESSKKLMPYFLDVMKHREVSNAIAAQFGVEHQSPQALVIKSGKAVLVQSHFEIGLEDLISAAG